MVSIKVQIYTIEYYIYYPFCFQMSQKIVLIDDSFIVRQVVAIALQKLYLGNIKIFTAEDGESGLNILFNKGFFLI